MRPLSTVQQKVFNKLRDHKRRTGDLPDLSSFARELGIHYVSLKQHIEALAKKGYLTFEGRGRGRSPIVDLPAELTGIPVLGSIPAGPLTEVAQTAESFLPLSGFHEQHFALRVQGDSMADLIQDGDIVMFEQRQLVRSGEICAVRVEGSEVTLKYVDFTNKDVYTLRPHNLVYTPIKVAAKDLEITGVYKGLLRGELAWAILQDKN
ncbi:MAG: LexA family protein [Trueperaceae bacterium]